MKHLPSPKRNGCGGYRPHIFALFLCLLPGVAAAVDNTSNDKLLVFAAASLKNALDAAATAFTAERNIAVKLAYGSSGTLARQLAQGAPASVFISANPAWMDYLQQQGVIRAETRVDLLSNALVVITPKASTLRLSLTPTTDFTQLLDGGRLAIGDPAHVPAGIYARAALQKLGLWQAVTPHLARADNVRAALALVARGEAPLGIVYSSDAQAEPNVRIAARLPTDSHLPIRYPAAQLVQATASENASGAAFLAYLQSPSAQAIFVRFGFKSLAAD